MKLKADHPSQFIDKKFSGVIQQSAAEAERMKDLHPEQLKLIYENKWFEMFIPREYGGLGWSLPQVLRLEEGLSWADGSTGWVVTLCGGAGWFVGFLQPLLMKEILSNEKVCIAGSGAAAGVAQARDNGYEVTGSWKYASGSLHATVFTANCIIQKEGRPLFNPDGSPLIKAFLFLKGEVTLRQHWNSIGMIATGSHSFEVKSLRLSSDRCFTIDARHSVLKDPVYQYPFLPLAETTLAVNLSGMTQRFLDLSETLLSNKIRAYNPDERKGPDLELLLLKTRAELDQCRFDFYKAVDVSWQVCLRGELSTQDILSEVSRKSYDLAHRSRQCVDELYPYCGLVAADPGEEINRVWRNIHTASQHAMLA